MNRPPALPGVTLTLITFLSLGLYVPIWFLRRRKALNHLAPQNDSVNMVTLVLAGLFAAPLALEYTRESSPN